MIGEAASKLSKEFRAAHSEIPWERIISLRHRLVHDYLGIEIPKVWKIVREHVPSLIVALEPLMRPNDPPPEGSASN